MTAMVIAASDLHNILDYDPLTGHFRWKGRRSGAPALNSLREDGYLVGRILGGRYYAHRVAWAMGHGAWPIDQIDHVNGDRSDNRLGNLRVVSPVENNRNRKRHGTSKTGVTGVFWSNAHKKWRAKITDHGRAIHLGYFASFTDAVLARSTAEVELRFHPNHGRVPSSV